MVTLTWVGIIAVVFAFMNLPTIKPLNDYDDEATEI